MRRIDSEGSTMPAATDSGNAVAIVTEGWWGLADAAAFYPDDLPDDWRLSYFANEYMAVYLPLQAWQAEPSAVLEGWQADVHAGFGFFLEWPYAADEAVDTAPILRAADALGDGLAALVQWGKDASAPGALWTPPSAGAPSRQIGQALHGSAALVQDLRAGARWLGERASRAPATLLLLPSPTSARLADWQRLPMLLGFEPLTPAHVRATTA
jgi:hypothetical protein